MKGRFRILLEGGEVPSDRNGAIRDWKNCGIFDSTQRMIVGDSRQPYVFGVAKLATKICSRRIQYVNFDWLERYGPAVIIRIVTDIALVWKCRRKYVHVEMNVFDRTRGFSKIFKRANKNNSAAIMVLAGNCASLLHTSEAESEISRRSPCRENSQPKMYPELE